MPRCGVDLFHGFSSFPAVADCGYFIEHERSRGDHARSAHAYADAIIGSTAAAAQICLKVGVGHPVLQLLLADRAWSTFLAHAVLSPWELLGLLGYVVSTGTWLLVLARADLSAAYPFVSLAFVATSLYGYWALHEPMSPARLSGIVLIVGGMLLVARS